MAADDPAISGHGARRRDRARACLARLGLLLGLLLGLPLGCGAGSERGVARAPREIPPAASAERATAPRSMAPRSAAPRSDVAEPALLGRPAPAWGSLPWLGAPLRLADLRGRVVLIRFFTDTCPFCRATAPALAQIDTDYRAQGVTVIGMYHPKPRGQRRTPAQVAEVVQDWGWRFPVALDLDWAVLDSFWLDSPWLDRGASRYTSVSFVLDRAGVIRHIHPGPEFHPGGPPDHDSCRRDYAEIRATLDALLAEPAPAEPVPADSARSP